MKKLIYKKQKQAILAVQKLVVRKMKIVGAVKSYALTRKRKNF